MPADVFPPPPPRWVEPEPAVPGTPLPGGNVGGAVRVGGTVRRPTGPWTPAVHALLRHVRARGLDGVPEPLGVDDAGREVLTYLPGVPVDLAEVTDGRLASAAAWLARYHAAVADLRPGPVRWRFEERDLLPHEIVCHHDATLYNMLVAAPGSDEVVGVVDWDVAGPGVPLDELAMLAWSGVPFYADPGPAEGARRLRLLVDAYAGQAARVGGVPPAVDDVARHVVVRMRAAGARIAAGQAAGDPGMLNLARVGEPARTAAQVDRYADALPALLAALASASSPG
ncbi:phosphotransferase [Cellulomonas sp. JZ18]|uniref:phosphotransferase n=1 Tax=Cellulomonas sp. JZ18 TaxID=2654191 RepID=UPI0012D4BDB7|nr:aminoglycoside phosphotransferase family protein [Cellulomonas sp. JZ18]QGQ20059.1 phosphotransferase [Cellulomonas sp. JZ18]